MFSKSHDDIMLSGLTLVTVVYLVEFDILSIETHPLFKTMVDKSAIINV